MKAWMLEGGNREKVLDSLRQSVWFSALDPAELEVVLGLGKLLSFDEGETVIAQGDPSDTFFLLVKGEARIEHLAAGGDVAELGHIWAPFSFGEIGVLLDRPRSATLIATRKVIVLAFNADELQNMVGRFPDFALSLSRALATRLAKVSELALPEHPEEEKPQAEALRLLPRALMERYRVLPLAVSGERIKVGFVESASTEALAAIRQHALGLEVEPVAIDVRLFNEAMKANVDLPEWRAPAAGREVSAARAMAPEIDPRLGQLLERMVAEGASDLHLSARRKPHWRIDGDIQRIDDLPALGAEEALHLIEPLLSESQLAELEQRHDVDIGYTLRGVGRFRVNLFRSLEGVNAAIRLIPHRILTPQQLGLPQIVYRFTEHPHGLVLVTGAAGSGKSTTLAALVEQINRRRPCHILTLEDPIEYVYEPDRALIDQRQVGTHALDFTRGLRSGLREDPDVILVGEVRDSATMALVLKAASSGHLVFATLHTASVVRTLDHIAEMFPGEEQLQTRATLADVLRGVITQRLLKKHGGGRVPACEILVVNRAISHLIRDGRTTQVTSSMQTARKEGNLLLNEHLAQLVNEKRVIYDEALAHTSDRNELGKKLGRPY